MNTLEDLNNFCLEQITYADGRAAGVKFDRFNIADQTVNINQHDEHNVPVGINIDEVIQPSVCTPVYVIDLSGCPGAEATWETIPSGCTVTNPSTDVYQISGVDSRAIWEVIRSPLITLPLTYIGTFTYTATIFYNTVEYKGWTVTANVADIDLMSVPTEFTFLPSFTGLLTGNPNIIDNYPTSWTVTVTPSTTAAVTTMSSAGSGGTTSFNSTSKVLTISGTKTQVNSHLDAISISIASGVTYDFTLSYSAVNITTSEADTKIQQMWNISYISATRSSDSYQLNTTVSITGGPLITDNGYTGTGDYTMTIVPNPTSALGSLSSTGRYDWANETVFTNPTSGSGFGYSTSVSTDGTYVAVGSPNIGASSPYYGVVRVYFKSGGSYSLQKEILGNISEQTLGVATSISADGTTLVFGVSGLQSVYVYTRSGTTWTKQATLKPSSIASGAYIYSTSLSSDGNTLYTGDYGGATTKTTIFVRSGGTWTEQTCFTPVGTIGSHGLGVLSPTGNTLVLSNTSKTGLGVKSRTSTATITSGITTNTGQKKFGTASLSFPGSGSQFDYTAGSLVVEGVTAKPSDTNFTLEFWMYANQTRDETLFSFFGTPAPYSGSVQDVTENFAIRLTTSYLNIVAFGNTTLQIARPSAATWHHIAVVKQSTVINVYINGSLAGTKTLTSSIPAVTWMRVGAENDLNYYTGPGGAYSYTSISNYFYGYMDDIRISAEAVYTANFAVPTTELDNRPLTKLLLNGNGTIEDNVQGNLNYGYNVTNQGSALVYTRSGTTWSLQQELSPSGSTSYDITNFGYSGDENRGGLFISSDALTIMIAAEPDNQTGYNYIFTYNGSTWVQSSITSGRIRAMKGDASFYIDDLGKSYFKNGSDWTYSGTVNTSLSGSLATDIQPDCVSTDGSTLVLASSSGTGSVGVLTLTSGVGTSWNSGTKTLTLTGEKSQVNADIDTIQLTPATAYESNFVLTYTVVTPESNTDSRDQNINYTTGE